MQKERLLSECHGQMFAEAAAHLGELREDQGAVAFGQQFLHHLGQPRQFSGSARKRRSVAQELRRMIAGCDHLPEAPVPSTE
jgi:hypothetical protein